MIQKKKGGGFMKTFKFAKGDKALHNGHRVVIGASKKRTEYGQTYYLTRPAGKPAARGQYVRSDYLEIA